MTPVIELQGVSKTYPGPSPVHAVVDVDLAIGPGEFVTIAGPSGSGKSTMLNLIGLLDRPTEGRVILDGVDSTEMREAERTRLRGRSIGFVFQSFELLSHRSALENVMMAGLYGGVPTPRRRDNSVAALAQVGLDHRIHALPGELSGGERQRVAIARALAGQPRLLLCDEPTGNLDSANADKIGMLLTSLHQHGTTVVVITHDARTAELGRRTVRLRDGRVE